MALSDSTLASELETAFSALSNEADAITAIAAAFKTYFQDASVTGVPAGDLSAAESAMAGAMTGLSTDAATAIQSGITAFWGVVASSAATIWIIAPNVATAVTPPPTLGGIGAALTSVFAANTSGEKSFADSAADIATALHTSGGIGGICIVTPPPPAAPFPSPVE